MKKKTHEEYVAELKEKNPTVEVVGKYKDAKTKILHHCLVHDVYWEAYPSSLLRGCGCEICKNDKIGMSNRKSHSQYVNEVKKNNPNVIVLEQYVNSEIPILHKCIIHNVEWKAYPASILRGAGCYKCGIERSSLSSRKTHDQYIAEARKINPNIVATENYVRALIPIKHKCLIDGYEWLVTPANVLSGKGCPKCAGNVKKTHSEYVNELALINPKIQVIEEYRGANTPIIHRCEIDGYEWKVTPSDAIHGKGCPKCNESLMERKVEKWLTQNNIEYERNKKFDGCIDIRQLSYDFYLPFYNTNIECQGIQHYEPIEHFGGEEQFKIQQRHDNIKRNYCISNSITLLEIPYYENVEETLNNFLLN